MTPKRSRFVAQAGDLQTGEETVEELEGEVAALEEMRAMIENALEASNLSPDDIQLKPGEFDHEND